VDVKVKKADSLLWACRRAFGVMWGLKHLVDHCLYVSVIWPSISLLWWAGCQMVSAKKRLSRVQRFTCLGIIGVIRTTPTGAMVALTGPLHWNW